MIKRFLLAGILIFSAQTAFAFVYQVQPLDKAAIKGLNDEKLVDNYIDVLVEVEASTTFHQTSGFRPRDYEEHKDLIKYRLLLEQEIKKRGLEAPGISVKKDPPSEVKKAIQDYKKSGSTYVE